MPLGRTRMPESGQGGRIAELRSEGTLLVPGLGGLKRHTRGARLQCLVPTKRNPPSWSLRGLARPDGPVSGKVRRREVGAWRKPAGGFRRPGRPGQLRRAVGPRRRPVAGSRLGGGTGLGPGRPRRPLLRARRERPSAPARSFSRPSLRCPRPRSLFGAETPLTSELLGSRSPAPRARPPGAADGAQRSPAGRLPEPPGAPGPPPRGPQTDPQELAGAPLSPPPPPPPRAVSPARAGTRAPSSRGFGRRGSAALPARPASQGTAQRRRRQAREPPDAGAGDVGAPRGGRSSAAPYARPQARLGFPFLGRSFRGQERKGGRCVAEQEPGGSRAGRAARAPGQRPELGRGSPASPRLCPGLAALRASPSALWVSASFLSPFPFLSPHLSACLSVLPFPSLPGSVPFCFSPSVPFPWGCASACMCSLSLLSAPRGGGLSPLCLCISLIPHPQIQRIPPCWRHGPPVEFMNSFRDWVEEAKTSPYLPPAPGAWPGSSPWN